MKKYTINFTDVKEYSEVYDTICKSLDFPDYCGRNLDAIWDCLTEMYGEPMYIEVKGVDLIRRKFGDIADKIIGILSEFKNFSDCFADDILIELVDGDTRTVIE